jgi:replication fork protection complex subunit Tof1/Swi1
VLILKTAWRNKQLTNTHADVKPSDDFVENSMFSNAKLRLLMESVGLERLGQEDVRGAQWVVPAAMSSTDLNEIISTINKSVENPIPEGSTEDPRQLLRRKETNSARESLAQGTLDVHFGSDSEGEDVPEGPLFPPNLRTKSNALDELKKKRKKKTHKVDDAEKEPLDDAILEERRQARLANALARQSKIKSDLFIHASDDETDEEADREFFRLEEERRKEQARNVEKAILMGDTEQVQSENTNKGKKASVRKRKSDTTATESKRRRRGSGSTGSDGDDDDDILMVDLDDESPRSQQEISTSHGAGDEDTPLTSTEDEMDFDDDLVFSRDRQTKPTDPEPPVDSDDEEETLVAPSSRRMRGGFVIESDSE